MTLPSPEEPSAVEGDPAPSGPGAVLAGRYVLGALLGSGGMGRVFAARDRKLQRDVAVKLLGAASPEKEALRRFEREALAASAVQHPNVVAVFDAGDEQGRPFLVTELLKGTTLRERLSAGALPVPEALRIARQVAEGLAAAHEKGFTHRDLKPENLFLTTDGWVKILDFGLVKLTQDLRPTQAGHDDHGSDDGATAVGRVMGTVGYMAPEQVRGKPVDPRADLFNLGLILYEMLSGVRAFRGGSPTETGYAILAKPPAPLPATVPRWLRELVLRCLEKDRELRPASARLLLLLLNAGKDNGRRFSLAGLVPPVGRRTRLALLALLLACAGAYAVSRWKPQRRPIATGAAPPSGTVAILPFSAHDAPRFAYLSEGAVDLLSRDLEGGDLRAVDSASALRAIGGDATADLDKVRGATAQLGAKYFVLGRVEERKGTLVLEAVLHTADGAPVSQAVAQGDPAQVLRLIRKLSDQLQLKPLSPEAFEARLDKLTLRTTRSPAALQAWLEGERLMRGYHFDKTMGAFQRAVAEDERFALAQYRLGVVSSPFEPGLAEDSLKRALTNSERLAPVERTLVAARIAMQQGRLSEAERLLVAATRDFPDEVEPWSQLGELYFHQNPQRGRPPQQAESAFQHVLVLDPLNLEALSHLIDLAEVAGEKALVSRLSDRLLAIADEPAIIYSYRLARSWARGDAAERGQVLQDLRDPLLASLALRAVFVHAAWQLDGFADAEAIAHLFSRLDSPGSAPSAEPFVLGAVHLLRGQPDAARVEWAKAAAADPAQRAAVLAVWVETLDFVPSTPAQLETARAALKRLDLSRSEHLRPATRYLEGALAVRAGQLAAADAAARDLETMPPLPGSSITRDLALGVRARALASRGDAAGALALLDKQELIAPSRYARYFLDLAEGWLRASVLTSLGRGREALPLYDALTFYDSIQPVYAPIAQLRRAQILDAAGDRKAAIDHYAHFVALWKDCEPSERPELERARVRLEQLRAQASASR